MWLLPHVHVVSLILVNAFHDSRVNFCGVAKIWFHSRAIASGLDEHGQVPRPFEQVGDVFMDDDVVDDDNQVVIIKQPSSSFMTYTLSPCITQCLATQTSESTSA